MTCDTYKVIPQTQKQPILLFVENGLIVGQQTNPDNELTILMCDETHDEHWGPFKPQQYGRVEYVLERNSAGWAPEIVSELRRSVIRSLDSNSVRKMVALDDVTLHDEVLRKLCIEYNTYPVVRLDGGLELNTDELVSRDIELTESLITVAHEKSVGYCEI